MTFSFPTLDKINEFTFDKAPFFVSRPLVSRNFTLSCECINCRLCLPEYSAGYVYPCKFY